jgi:hypothetical protein
MKSIEKQRPDATSFEMNENTHPLPASSPLVVPSSLFQKNGQFCFCLTNKTEPIRIHKLKVQSKLKTKFLCYGNTYLVIETG